MDIRGNADSQNGFWTPEEEIARLESRGSAPAVVEVRDQTLIETSGQALAERARKAAASLAAAGVASGDVVAIHAKNSADWIAAGLACGWLGAVLAPIDVLVSRAEARQTAEDLGAKLFLDDNPGTEPGGPEMAMGALWEAEGTASVPAASPGPDSPAAVFRTSGTTGRPKVFYLSRRNIGFNVAATVDGELVGPKDRVLMPLPMHHVFPWIVGTLVPLAAGAAVVLPQGMTGPEIATALKLGKPTVAVGVPKLFEAVLDAIRSRFGWVGREILRRTGGFDARTGIGMGPLLMGPVRRKAAPALRLMVSGGAKLDPKSRQALETFGWDVRCGYGLSETAAIFTGELKRKRTGTEGQPLDGCEVRIESPNAEGVGEILLRGPNVISGYLDNEDATARAFDADGFFRSGDLGCLDADGFLTVTGRSKEVIVLGGGENIYPEELEKRYEADKVIVEMGVLEFDGALVGLVVADMAEIRRRGSVEPHMSVRIALSRTAQKLPSTQRLTDFRILHEALPRTRLGKLRRFLLPDLYRRAGSTEADRVEPPTPEEAAWLAAEPRRSVWDLVCAGREPNTVGLESDLALDLGFDSFAWMSLALGIDEKTGVRLEAPDIAAIRTVRDLLDRVDELHGSEAPMRPGQHQDRLNQAIAHWLAPQSVLERIAGTLTMALIAGMTRLVVRLRVEGRENLPAAGPAILCPNHTSFLDPLAVSTALPYRLHRHTVWAADPMIMFESPVLRHFCRPMRVFPADERVPDVTIGLAREALRQGNLQVWFPEGWCSADGKLLPLQPGIGRLILESRAPVVPVNITGAWETWPRDRALPSPGGRVKLRFAQPIAADEILRQAGGETATAVEVAAKLHERMDALMPRS